MCQLIRIWIHLEIDSFILGYLKFSLPLLIKITLLTARTALDSVVSNHFVFNELNN